MSVKLEVIPGVVVSNKIMNEQLPENASEELKHTAAAVKYYPVWYQSLSIGSLKQKIYPKPPDNAYIQKFPISKSNQAKINTINDDILFRILYDAIILANIKDRHLLIILMKTCKLWREIIINSFDKLQPIWKRFIYIHFSAFNWKNVLQLPKIFSHLVEYVDMSKIKKFNKDEQQFYDAVRISEEFEDEYFKYDEYDYDIFLLIYMFFQFPNIDTLVLQNMIPTDVYFAMDMCCKNIENIAFKYCTTNLGIIETFGEQGKFPELQSICIERGGCGFNFGFAQYYPKLKIIELEKQWFNGDDFCLLMKYCTQLEYINFFRFDWESNGWKQGYLMLAQNNRVIRHIYMDCAPNFDDECCRIFENRNICPNLVCADIGHVPASQDAIIRLKRIRPCFQLSPF